jgi:hypothetical protein
MQRSTPSVLRLRTGVRIPPPPAFARLTCLRASSWQALSYVKSVPPKPERRRRTSASLRARRIHLRFQCNLKPVFSVLFVSFACADAHGRHAQRLHTREPHRPGASLHRSYVRGCGRSPRMAQRWAVSSHRKTSTMENDRLDSVRARAGRDRLRAVPQIGFRTGVREAAFRLIATSVWSDVLQHCPLPDRHRVGLPSGHVRKIHDHRQTILFVGVVGLVRLDLTVRRPA